MIVCTPLVAAVSDRSSAGKPLFLISIVGYLLLTLPRCNRDAVAFRHAHRSCSIGFRAAECDICRPAHVGFGGAISTRVRATAISLGTYSLAAMIGVFSPSLGTWLIATTGDLRAPAFTVIGVCFISGFALFLFKDRYREPLL